MKWLEQLPSCQTFKVTDFKSQMALKKQKLAKTFRLFRYFKFNFN